MQSLAIEYLRRTVRAFPDKAAVRDADATITFAELWASALRLARRLRDKAEGRHVPVVLDMPKSIQAVVAVAATQLAGAIYVPFDPDSPQQRRERMLGRLGPHLLLQAAGQDYVLDGESLGCVSGSDPDVAKLESALMASLAERGTLDPLYVIFTSGTTGTPKGVTIANASVIDYIDWAIATYGVDHRDVIGNQAPLYFDNSVLDLYLTFATGCTLHLIPSSAFRFPGELVEYLAEHRVSFVFFVPSVFAPLVSLDLLEDFDGSHLRKVLFAGEAMPLSTVKYLRRRLPDALLSNLYGPTEITVDCLYWIAPETPEDLDELEDTPLGGPCHNARIVLLDDDGSPVVADEVVAEICVGGPGVSLGYWNDPEATASRFVPNPEHRRYREIIYRTGDLGYRSSKDGLVYMVGRKDHQFKHLGHRIEPGEIESALTDLGAFAQSCVQYDPKAQEIVAFVVTAAVPSPEEIDERLQGALPAYMIPRRFVALDRLPATPSGKVDREALWRAYGEGSIAADGRVYKLVDLEPSGPR